MVGYDGWDYLFIVYEQTAEFVGKEIRVSVCVYLLHTYECSVSHSVAPLPLPDTRRSVWLGPPLRTSVAIPSPFAACGAQQTAERRDHLPRPAGGGWL